MIRYTDDELNRWIDGLQNEWADEWLVAGLIHGLMNGWMDGDVWVDE